MAWTLPAFLKTFTFRIEVGLSRPRDVMYAENLKLLLLSLSEKQDVSAAGYPELTERFVALRGSALLPRGRDKREQVIMAREIVSVIL
jgi:hypothetical protein